MSKKSIKISFQSVNGGKYTVIKQSDIAETNIRVKEEMEKVVREYEKNETISLQNAAKVFLNK